MTACHDRRAEALGRWSREQAEALRRRDLNAVAWEHVIHEISELGSFDRMDWVSYRTIAVERLLLIEHYQARADKPSRWRAGPYRARSNFHFACRKIPSLLADSLE